MAWIGIALMVALTTNGYYAAVNDEKLYQNRVVRFYDQKETGDYASYETKMAELYEKNKKFMEVQNLKDLDDLRVGHKEYSGDENNCMTVTTVVEPFVLDTKKTDTAENEHTKDIVVQLDHFRQKIKWTKCLYPNKSCFGNVFTPEIDSVETKCVEKYAAVSLYVYDKEKQEYLYKMYDVPVACVCKFEPKLY